LRLDRLEAVKVAALALILAFAAAHDGYAQEYPAKPIRLIISSSPGSGVDTIARAVAQRMSEALGVPIIPDNRAGGGGTIGVQAVAKAPADGYTLLMGAPSFTVNATLIKPPPTSFRAISQPSDRRPRRRTSSSCILRCR
jgi:tripartite-type tricarboxylate transporter receptor subunit TctC